MTGVEPRQFGIFRLSDGTRVCVRPACPGDAARIQDYVRGLAASSRYDRFLGAVKELAPADLDRIRASDDRHAALVIEAGSAGARFVIGEARYAALSEGNNWEIALSVADAWRRRGLGALLLDFLECRARGRGARTLVADVLRSNAAMRTLARKAGFATTAVPVDARLVRIVKDISGARIGTPCAHVMRSRLPLAA